jgi:hypothetical protein
MNELIQSVKLSLATGNWHGALITTLTLPDIAGKIDSKIPSSNERYAAWFDKYVGNNYKSKIGAQQVEHIFLSGNDCYALRCSYLHEGTSEITHQRARDVLEDFKFVSPPKSSKVHCNQLNTKLQLQVDIFCKDILDGISQWLIDIKNDPVKQ